MADIPPDAGTQAALKIEQTYMASGTQAASQALYADFANFMKAPGGQNLVNSEAYQLANDDPGGTGALSAIAVNWALSPRDGVTNIEDGLSQENLSVAAQSAMDYGPNKPDGGNFTALMDNTLNNDFGTISGMDPPDPNASGIEQGAGDSLTFTGLQNDQAYIASVRANGGVIPPDPAITPLPPETEVQKILGVFGIDGNY